ncbi:MAG: META domain-containing protein [Actinobacteria bacterium]|nr:META domain-containing protein [Actinomycetota bacterium]
MTTLTGTWQVDGPDVHAPHGAATLTFEGDGMVFGCSGINRVRGTWQLSQDVLTFGPLASTLMAGSPAAMAAEQALQSLLAEPLHLEPGEDGALVLRAPDARSVRLVPAAPSPTLA